MWQCDTSSDEAKLPDLSCPHHMSCPRVKISFNVSYLLERWTNFTISEQMNLRHIKSQMTSSRAHRISVLDIDKKIRTYESDNMLWLTSFKVLLTSSLKAHCSKDVTVKERTRLSCARRASHKLCLLEGAKKCVPNSFWWHEITAGFAGMNLNKQHMPTLQYCKQTSRMPAYVKPCR